MKHKTFVVCTVINHSLIGVKLENEIGAFFLSKHVKIDGIAQSQSFAEKQDIITLVCTIFYTDI